MVYDDPDLSIAIGLGAFVIIVLTIFIFKRYVFSQTKSENSTEGGVVFIMRKLHFVRLLLME